MSTDYYELAMKYRDLFVSVNDEIICFLARGLSKTALDAFELSKGVKSILEEKRQELKDIDKGN